MLLGELLCGMRKGLLGVGVTFEDEGAESESEWRQTTSFGQALQQCATLDAACLL